VTSLLILAGESKPDSRQESEEVIRRTLLGSLEASSPQAATLGRKIMRVTLPSTFRRVAPALAFLLLAGVTALPASAQYGSTYYPPAPGYYGNGTYWNNASYYVYQNNPNRYRNTNGNTDFGYATIPPTVNPDSTTTVSEEPNDGRMYLYNFTGGAVPVYENPAGTPDLHCFPC
jgi:hypothetical protein